MRRLSFVLLIVVSTADATAQRGAGAATGVVAGMVIDAVTNAPVGSVVVGLERNGRETRQALSGPDGRFLFAEASPGAYALTASKGSAYGAYGRAWDRGAGATFQLKSAQRFESLRIPLWRPASIEGTVYDERGDPLAGAYVSAITTSADLFALSRGSNSDHVETDNRGRYTLTVSAGAYRVGVLVSHDTTRARPYSEPTPVLTFADSHNYLRLDRQPLPPPPGPRGESMTYVTTVAPSAATPGAGQVFNVKPGDSQSRVDIHMKIARRVRVSGEIVRPTGNSDSIQLVLHRDDLDAAGAYPPSTFSTDDHFTFLSVPPGSYRLEAWRALQSDSHTNLESLLNMFATMDVVVGDDDITHLVVQVRKGVTLSGAHPSGRGPAFFQPLPTLTAVPPRFDQGYIRPSPIWDDTTFKFAGLPPGRYLLSMKVGQTIVSTAMIRGVNAADVPVELGDADVEGVVITLSPPGSISGVVRDARGVADDAVVALFPVDPILRVRTDPPRRLRIASPGPDGTFAVKDLPEGNYYAVALRGPEFERAQATGSFDAFVRNTTTVVVTKGAVVTVDLRVQER